MKIHLFTLVAISSSLLFTGCSSQPSLESRVEELTNQVDILSYQVTTLQKATIQSRNSGNVTAEVQSDIADLKGEVTTIFASSALAYDEAIRANLRIDNMAQSYTK